MFGGTGGYGGTGGSGGIGGIGSTFRSCPTPPCWYFIGENFLSASNILVELEADSLKLACIKLCSKFLSLDTTPPTLAYEGTRLVLYTSV
jgi:hypothetical protein